MIPDGPVLERLRCRSAAGHAAALLVALLLALPAAAGAMSPEAEMFPPEVDLHACIALALQHSPAIRRAEEQVSEQIAATRETRAARLPRLDASALYAIEDSERVDSFGGGGDQSDTTWNAGLEAGMSLYSGGRLPAELRAQQARQESLRAGSAAVANDVVLMVATRYYAALLSLKQISVQEEALHLFGLQLERARNQFEAGAGPRFDVLQAEVALANAKPPLVRARNSYRIAVEELRQAVGLPLAPGQDPAEIRLLSDWPGISPLEPVEQAIRRATQDRPELRALREQLRAAQEQVAVAQRERTPSVRGYANYLFQNDRFSGSDDDVLEGWGIGIRATFPVWDGGAIRGRVLQADSKRLQLDLRREELRIAVEVELRKAWFDLEQAGEILQTADLVIEQAREALRLAENRYRAGALTQLDVLQSQLELTRAQLERVQAAHDYHVAHSRFLWAQGLPPAP